MDETDDTVFLMYTSFFQPLMREALGPAMHQMLDEERQMQVRTVGSSSRPLAFRSLWCSICPRPYTPLQLVGLHNAEDYRAACQQ